MSRPGDCWFITATDTDAGKTWITAHLARALRAAGGMALKPVACGADADGHYADLDALLAAQGLEDAQRINFARFPAWAAPAQAARAAGARLDVVGLLAWCRARMRQADPLLIEGVGGLMVPVAAGEDGPDWLVRDWIAALPECRVCLVVACRLGAINHALLTIEALCAMGRAPALVICNAPRPADEAWLSPVAEAVRPWLPAGAALRRLEHGQAPKAGWLTEL
ncbi:MAG: dethiobiotin synthase [Mariprofundaceae bacterium]